MTTEVDFPAELPGPLLGSLQNGGDDPWVSDQSSVGANRRRARYTRFLERFTFVIRINESQRQLLNQFYQTTLAMGTLSFNWTHPMSNVSYEVRFDERPSTGMLRAHLYDATVNISEI